jgi:hypothetical protein
MTEKKLEELGKERIYKYCDDNIGNKILFPGFVFTGFDWLYHNKISPQNLTNLIGIIIRDLTEKKILKEVEKDFESLYAMYEILPHEKLFKKIKKR